MILKSLDKYRDFGLLVLRAGIGAAFVCHGFPKLAAGAEIWEKVGGAMSLMGVPGPAKLWGLMAALSEFGGGLLLIAGYCFRPAAAAMLFTMTVAVRMHLHGGDPFGKYSHALEMGIVFLGLFFTGPGRFSMDGDHSAKSGWDKTKES